MERAQTSASSPRTHLRWKFAFSTRLARLRSSASSFPNTRIKSGMDTWRMSRPEVSMATACMVPMLRKKAIDSIPANSCSIRMLAAISKSWIGTPAVFGYKMEFADDLTFDERDSAPFMPRCTVVDPNFDWRGSPERAHVPWDDTIFYEVHVKGFTKRHPAVPEG